MSERALPPLPEHLGAQLWWGDSCGQTAPGNPAHDAAKACWPSGHAALDAQLPGGGWPRSAMTEVLQPAPLLAEWRLLGPGLASLVARGASLVLIGPPHEPHLPGLMSWGLRPERLVWVAPALEAQRLWATEQALKADALTAVLAWLPQARPEQLRRLQSCANRHAGLLFVFRPLAAAQTASPAPLRLSLSLDAQQADLRVRVLKRRGASLNHELTVSVPSAWQRLWGQVLAPSLPSSLVRPALAQPLTPLQESLADHGALDRLVAG